ncbi:MAG: hypothetical protein ACRDN8_26200, partial [Thermoleophilaceae bacterium]
MKSTPNIGAPRNPKASLGALLTPQRAAFPLPAKPGNLLARVIYEAMEMKANHSWLKAILLCFLTSTILPSAWAADLPVNWTELPEPFHTR